MDKLEKARKVINEVDEQMAKLFIERMKAVKDVISYKMENNLPVLDSKREKEVIQKNLKYLDNHELDEYYINFITDVMDISKSYQKSILSHKVIGYGGAEGAFSHIASKRLFPDDTLTSYKTFEEVFQAVSVGEIEYGVIPFENSYTGEVGEVLDLLLKYPCHICDMYDLKIDQNLLGLKEAKLEDITQVYSHHQAISQSQKFLNGRGFEIIPYPNTALAAKYISETNDIHKGAIASKETAELYGLKILVENINTSNQNTTRFVVISKKLSDTGNRFNLLFTVNHDAGQLAKVMQIIANLGLNMESIKSRSLKDLPWQYYFYVELIGNPHDDKVKLLLEQMNECCRDVKILGTYTRKESRD